MREIRFCSPAADFISPGCTQIVNVEKIFIDWFCTCFRIEIA